MHLKYVNVTTYLKKPTENLILQEPLSALLLNKIHT